MSRHFLDLNDRADAATAILDLLERNDERAEVRAVATIAALFIVARAGVDAAAPPEQILLDALAAARQLLEHARP